jgi:hypothetical protein
MVPNLKKKFYVKKILWKKKTLKSEKNMNHKKYDWNYETKYSCTIWNHQKLKTENLVQ